MALGRWGGTLHTTHITDTAATWRWTPGMHTAVTAPLTVPPDHRRWLHTTAPTESTAILAAGLGVAGMAVAAQYALRAWERTTADATKRDGGDGDEAASKTTGTAPAEGAGDPAAPAGGGTAATGAKVEGAAAGSGSGGGIFGAQAFARRFYKGGFEDKMSKREAALVLGVRESSPPERIRDRHRKLLMLNHPDTGGSTYLASKINEAKEIMIKGRKSLN